MTPRLFRLAAGAFLIAAGGALSAEAAPIPDWLRPVLTPEARAWREEGAATRLLDDQNVQFEPNGAMAITIRGAVRVHSELGLAFARMGQSYDPNNDKILAVTAWVIAPDEKKAQRFDRSDFLDHVQQYNKYFWDSQRVIEFVAGDRVPLGGILAWELKLETHPGFAEWSNFFLPSALPTFRTAMEVTPEPGAHLDWYAADPRLQPAPGASPGSLHWQLDRLRPIPQERPAHFLPNPLAVFVRSSQGEPETWPGFGGRAAAIMEPRIDPTGPVKALADELVAGKTERWDRIRALSEWVQAQIVYLAISLDQDNLAGYRPHPAAEILRNRYGDCKDKATLLISLLRAIGEDGHIVLLFSGDPKFVESKWPSAEFNHAIVAIPAAAAPVGWPVVEISPGQKVVIFDPTDPFTPLGVLPNSDQGGFALIIQPGTGALARLPMAAADSSKLRRTTTATLALTGRLVATTTEIGSGATGALEYGARANLNAAAFQRLTEARIHRSSPLMEKFSLQEGWNAAQAKYTLAFAFEIPGYGRRIGSGSMLLVQPTPLPDTLRLPEWKMASALGVAAVDATTREDETRLTLPAELKIEEVPDPWQLSNGDATVQLSYAVEGTTVVYRSRFQRKAGFYSKARYEALRLLYQSMQEQERRPILLRAADHS